MAPQPVGVSKPAQGLGTCDSPYPKSLTKSDRNRCLKYLRSMSLDRQREEIGKAQSSLYLSPERRLTELDRIAKEEIGIYEAAWRLRKPCCCHSHVSADRSPPGKIGSARLFPRWYVENNLSWECFLERWYGTSDPDRLAAMEITGSGRGSFLTSFVSSKWRGRTKERMQ